METLTRSIAIARRRMTVERWFRLMPRWLAALLVVAAVAIAAERLGWLELVWWVGLVGALVAGVAGAAVHALLTRPSRMAAALEIDRRFELRERVSSAWALDAHAQQTPIGQAVLDDACRQLARLSVGQRFGMLPDRKTWLPLVPALLIVLVAFLVGPWKSSPAVAEASSPAESEVRRSSEALRKKLIEQRRRARQEGFEDAESLLQQLEKRSQELTAELKQNPKQSLIRLNELARQVRQRQQQLASDAVKQQLRMLKDLGDGPANRFARALRRGNFKQAIQELERLKQQLADEKLTREQKEQLMKQLQKMADKLQQLVEAQNEVRRQLEKQLAEAQAAGREEEAERLKEQLQQLEQKLAQQERMKQLATQASQCAACLGENDSEAAADLLNEMQASLNELARDNLESKLLDDVLGQIAQCKACMGNMLGKKGGDDREIGQGQGMLPEQEDATKTYNTRVRQQVGRGTSTLVDLVDGPTRKGQVEQQIATQFENAQREASAPVTTQRLPQPYREQTKSYFDALLQGE